MLDTFRQNEGNKIRSHIVTMYKAYGKSTAITDTKGQ